MDIKTIHSIFIQAIMDYHVHDHVDAEIVNPYPESIQNSLYHKAWIDTVQWHLEDIIRDPNITPENALLIKRRIDQSNQDRTDLVEQIDDYFVSEFSKVEKNEHARLNTESMGWAIDRLSILCLKVYHMDVEVNRTNSSAEQIKKCRLKLDTLEQQMLDLQLSIQQLIEDITAGIRYTKVYHQMKMYNDPTLNPILYTDKEK